MTSNTTNCPYCNSTCTLNEHLLKHLKNFDWALCANCGLFLKVTIDKASNKLLSVDKYDTVVKLGFACSHRLNKAYPYAEPPIPEDICQELKQIMIGIKVNTHSPNPANPTLKTFKSPASWEWVMENLMPKIIPIFNEYPSQIEYIMNNLGFGSLLQKYKTTCQNCGLEIPYTRKNSCPFCLNGKAPPPPE
jgi:transcription elongation factor Elf1